MSILSIADSESWRVLLELLLAPLAWIPRLQQGMADFLLGASSPWLVAARVVLLAAPFLLLTCALWCTTLSAYSLVVRSRRRSFAAAIFLAWWDGLRSIWLYWTGLLRFALAGLGWALGVTYLTLVLGLELLRHLVVVPFSVAGRLGRLYFRRGRPWLALLLLAGWAFLESAVLAQVLFPAVSAYFVEMVGVEVPPATGPLLQASLFLLVLGSFAVLLQVIDALRTRERNLILRASAAWLLVSAFELLLLYRPLVAAASPWIAGGAGATLAAGWTLLLAAGIWAALRSVGWLLFGRFGAPVLVALLARRDPEASPDEGPAPSAAAGEDDPWRFTLREYQREIDWLHRRSDELIGHLTLPVLQVLAAILNFAMVVITAKPVFDLPLESARQLAGARQILNRLDGEKERIGDPSS